MCPRSSTGQSGGLLIRGLQVRVLPGAPFCAPFRLGEKKKWGCSPTPPCGWCHVQVRVLPGALFCAPFRLGEKKWGRSPTPPCGWRHVQVRGQASSCAISPPFPEVQSPSAGGAALPSFSTHRRRWRPTFTPSASSRLSPRASNPRLIGGHGIPDHPSPPFMISFDGILDGTIELLHN